MTSSDVEFTASEREVLSHYFTNTDGRVFALVNLPDVVKGALFARYSRSGKSLRRLFLDEFYNGAGGSQGTRVGLTRAEDLYERVFLDYGDDSVAQLVGVHVAVEGASNILTKILERGRLMSALEQSTRYVPYNDRPGGNWRYIIPEELANSSLRRAFKLLMDRSFEAYAKWFDPMQHYLREKHPRDPADSDAVYKMSIRSKACDILRGFLPAATVSNVGLFGSAQAFEALLLRLRRHPLAEARGAGQRMLEELRKVIPVFVRRVDDPERGEAWSDYLRKTQDGMRQVVRDMLPDPVPEAPPQVALTDYDSDGEVRVVADALYPFTNLPGDQLLAIVSRMSQAERETVLRSYVGGRTNRRHKPGRAFERTYYRFEIIADYGIFRDLQRHRMLTIDWQPLSPRLGYDMPHEVCEVGAERDWTAVMRDSAQVFDDLVRVGLDHVAQYAVCMAYKLRFYMEMNAREAMHVIELRTSEQGHRNYRSVCQDMLRLIGEQAGHRGIAASMKFARQDGVGLERLGGERRSDEKRRALLMD